MLRHIPELFVILGNISDSLSSIVLWNSFLHYCKHRNVGVVHVFAYFAVEVCENMYSMKTTFTIPFGENIMKNVTLNTLWSISSNA